MWFGCIFLVRLAGVSLSWGGGGRRGSRWFLPPLPRTRVAHFLSHLLAGKWELSGEMKDAGGRSP